ncbi:DNA helicase II [Psychrobium sp. 1_MG-2023]|uniref:DNA helicase II n=1 Tax=Psychrobium sp. 1_MG-2023 TaxID=3062624 RepID=UPI000C337E8D|nr:DNA helicase II [Psychrobium sp. 1_MG-2023]MDP2562005.1 DNA helicase II [Psychrobium sp. 1_MG-2023]PKF58695.1 DNA helicase II [Alteromonadales bacterium alter-6D02]
MDVSLLLDGLNDKQRDAVAAQPGNQLVLAGAGSGKTRVLVHRIAWLLKVEQHSTFSILAVTFTNKAAKEMRYRVESLLGDQLGKMWIGTFHGIAHRLLRMHYSEAKLPENFQVIDSDDQFKMLKRILKSMNLDEKSFPPRQVQSYINSHKDEGLRPKHIETYGDAYETTMRDLYKTYQDACDRAGLVDFAELLLRAHELWLNNPQVLSHYQRRFSNILVDEFQDTNNIQYAWIKMLAGQHNNIMIVGDDDQSIYGWRGAKVENLQRFLTDYPKAQTIKLEQNYRSTSNILEAANAVISNNTERLGKKLWTEDNKGDPISLYAAFNELDEARFISNKIKEWHEQGGNLEEVAILYRSNAQSRVIEEALLAQQLPYRIYGGLRFYDRLEIKDTLGYLRLMSNRDDDAAFERVVNTPARGIGATTLDKLRHNARQQGMTLWQVSKLLLSEKILTGRAANAVKGFLSLIEQLEDDSAEMSLRSMTDFVVNHSGLKTMYQNEKGDRAQDRIENLDQLLTAMNDFIIPEEAEEMTPLNAFLSHAALESGDSQADEYDDAVQLMTMHSAKGLEFPMVLIAGVEEGMFPSTRTMEEPDKMEEERRLAYVGITRAMKKLYISHAESRRLYGQEKFHKPSRFIREIPSELVDEIRLTTQVSRPTQYNRFNQSQEQFNETGLSLGQRVTHSKFGDGTIINYEGSGAQSRVEVSFDDVGTKWLFVAYARLEVI